MYLTALFIILFTQSTAAICEDDAGLSNRVNDFCRNQFQPTSSLPEDERQILDQSTTVETLICQETKKGEDIFFLFFYPFAN